MNGYAFLTFLAINEDGRQSMLAWALVDEEKRHDGQVFILSKLAEMDSKWLAVKVRRARRK